MSANIIQTIYWGYSPMEGKKVYMVHGGKLLIDIAVNSMLSPIRYMQESFWPEVDYLKKQISLGGHRISSNPMFGVCQVDVTLALQNRDDIRFHSLESLKLISGLEQLDRKCNFDLWQGIAFIETHLEKL